MHKIVRSIFCAVMFHWSFVLGATLDVGTYVIKNIKEEITGGTGGTRYPIAWLYAPEAFYAQEDVFISVLNETIKMNVIKLPSELKFDAVLINKKIKTINF